MERTANTAMIEISEEIEISNIILFPRSKINQEEAPKTMEEAQERLDETRTFYVENVTEEAMEALMQIFMNYGFFTKPEKNNQKDMVAIQETIKAGLLRYHNLQHPMQGVIDQAIEVYDKEE